VRRDWIGVTDAAGSRDAGILELVGSCSANARVRARSVSCPLTRSELPSRVLSRCSM
jgi:hypothetical protein